MKVLYVIGKGRAGGTLLNNILGQIDGFVAPGELPRLWTWGLSEGWLCGCGMTVRECPFWSRVISEIDGFDLQEVLRWQRQVLSWWSVPRLLHSAMISPSRWPALSGYAALMGRVYQAIASVSNARVIVESTRWPCAPVALGLIPQTEVFLLHLVRDPRAVVYSWKREKVLADRPGEPKMQRFGVSYTMASWFARTALTEIVMKRCDERRTLLLRYEDFVANPETTTGRIVTWMEEHTPQLDFIRGNKVNVIRTHTVGGNPDRLRTGEISVRSDDEWLYDQPPRDRFLATLMSLPLLKRYDYPLFPRHSIRTGVNH